MTIYMSISQSLYCSAKATFESIYPRWAQSTWTLQDVRASEKWRWLMVTIKQSEIQSSHRLVLLIKTEGELAPSHTMRISSFTKPQHWRFLFSCLVAKWLLNTEALATPQAVVEPGTCKWRNESALAKSNRSESQHGFPLQKVLARFRSDNKEFCSILLTTSSTKYRKWLLTKLVLPTSKGQQRRLFSVQPGDKSTRAAQRNRETWKQQAWSPSDWWRLLGPCLQHPRIARPTSKIIMFSYIFKETTCNFKAVPDCLPWVQSPESCLDSTWAFYGGWTMAVNNRGRCPLVGGCTHLRGFLCNGASKRSTSHARRTLNRSSTSPTLHFHVQDCRITTHLKRLQDCGSSNLLYESISKSCHISQSLSFGNLSKTGKS